MHLNVILDVILAEGAARAGSKCENRVTVCRRVNGGNRARVYRFRVTLSVIQEPFGRLRSGAYKIVREAPCPAISVCHTGARLDVVYRVGDRYIPEALDKLDHFLRDHRTGDIHHYDPRLFDLLNDLTASVGRAGAELHVICGYRSPWSNEFLRNHTAGVALHSLHRKRRPSTFGCLG